jgi:uridylate kinase
VSEPAFERVLLKLSGEALMGDREYGQAPERIAAVARAVGEVVETGVEMAIVVGGGNILRGTQEAARGHGPSHRRLRGHAGHRAERPDGAGRARAAGRVHAGDVGDRRVGGGRALHPPPRHPPPREGARGDLRRGTGNPFFTTDTAAALRALEIGAQAILMGKNGVDGVLDDDPRTNPKARLIPQITHIEAIERGLKVMDTTALSLCMDNALPLYVFNLDDEHNIARIARGERLGTIISSVPGGLPVQVTP